MYLRDKWFGEVKTLILWISNRLSSYGSVWMLHECVNDIAKAYNPQYSISASSFEKMIEERIKENYSFRRIDELKNSMEKDIFVTFDDGRDCVYAVALPILQKYNIPFCVFIITGKIGEEGYLSKDDILEMDKCPLCTLGSHTVSHRKLRELTRKQVFEELSNSKKELEMLVNHEIKYMAYPYGDIKATSYKDIRIARKCQYVMAFSTLQCSIKRVFLKHKLFIPRLNINEESYYEEKL